MGPGGWRFHSTNETSPVEQVDDAGGHLRRGAFQLPIRDAQTTCALAERLQKTPDFEGQTSFGQYQSPFENLGLVETTEEGEKQEPAEANVVAQ